MKSMELIRSLGLVVGLVSDILSPERNGVLVMCVLL
jgi:hypothetical protein